MLIHGIMGGGFLRGHYPRLVEMLGGMPVDQVVDRLAGDLSKAIALPGKYDLPVIMSSFFGREDNFTASYQDHDTPVYEGPEKAARAMLALYYHSLVRSRPPYERPLLPDPHPQATALISAALDRGLPNLDEASSKELLKIYGAPVSRDNLARSTEEAVKMADTTG